MMGGDFLLREQSMPSCDVRKRIICLGDGRSRVGEGQLEKELRGSYLVAKS